MLAARIEENLILDETGQNDTGANGANGIGQVVEKTCEEDI